MLISQNGSHDQVEFQSRAEGERNNQPAWRTLLLVERKEFVIITMVSVRFAMINCS